jgi:DUF2934 family protein
MLDKEQLIREAAYHLWEADGRPIGQADRHWEMAMKLTEEAESAPSTARQKRRRSPARQVRRAS